METNIERGRETERETEGSWELKIKESEGNPFEKITKTDLGLSLKTVSVATAEANPVIYTNKNKTEQTMLCFFLFLLFFFWVISTEELNYYNTYDNNNQNERHIDEKKKKTQCLSLFLSPSSSSVVLSFLFLLQGLAVFEYKT